jgi:hypothetical protein
MTYDINNNCIQCDAYVYDQHQPSCMSYVRESYSEFLKRIQITICGDCLIPLNQCQHAKDYVLSNNDKRTLRLIASSLMTKQVNK